MKKTIILFIFCNSVVQSFAQPISRQSFENKVIGWMKIYHFKGFKESKKVDDKFYSAAQLSLCDSFANWMQASYIPKGGLGDVKKGLSEKLGLYNQHTAAKPQSYGAYSKTYMDLKYNSSGKMEPATNSHINWSVFANNLPAEWPARDFCTTLQYYFTLPMAETEESDEKIKKQLDISKEPSIKRYISFWVKNLGSGRGRQQVLLCKDNKSPLIKITKGEYLQACEAAIPRYYEEEKKKIYEKEKGNQKSIDYFMKYLDEKKERLTTGLKYNREKYTNRLDELAMTGYQPSISDLEFEKDVFSNGRLKDPESTSGRMPVYKVDPAMAELCKKDKPQWILVSWDYYPGDALEQQQHDAIIHHFNFDYVYNFFFNPEKVMGQPYKPLSTP